jgi:hypothetical protein
VTQPWQQQLLQPPELRGVTQLHEGLAVLLRPALELLLLLWLLLCVWRSQQRMKGRHNNQLPAAAGRFVQP